MDFEASLLPCPTYSLNVLLFLILILRYLLKGVTDGCLEVIIRFDGEVAGLLTTKGLEIRLPLDEFRLETRFELFAFLWILSLTLFI